MMKTSVPLKVAIGYAVVLAISGLAAWMVYGNMRTFVRINETERTFNQRRDLIDSLVYSFMQTSNKERAITLGDIGQWESYERSLRNTLALSERLQDALPKTAQDRKIDSLQTLLRMNRDNTLLIMRMMSANRDDNFLADKVNNLHRGADSVIIHPKAKEVTENKQTVYEVVKSRKGFFARLADAFKRQHSDTLRVRHDSLQVTDSTQRRINIAHDVANVLSDIALKDHQLRDEKRRQLKEQERQQQLVSIKIAEQTDQLLRDIRGDERNAKQVVLAKNVTARRDVIAKMVLLALVSLLLAGVLVFLVWRDVKREQRDRMKLKASKEETERLMAQRERLMLTITHDIKAPAASISGFTQLLAEKVKSDPQTGTYARNINASATHLLHLVTTLLDYHSLESGKAQTRATTFSPSRLIADCAEGMRPQAENKGLWLSCDVSRCTQAFAKGDSFRMTQIVDNLLSNACKYTSRGGITVRAVTSVDHLVVSVTDTGCGMTEEETKSIFRAFTRLPEAQGEEGIGLGLSIVKELVALLRGSIQVHSEKGTGTTFRVSLPIIPVTSSVVGACAAVPGASQPSAVAHRVAPPTGIVVLDDDKLQLQLLNEILHRLVPKGCRVVTCQHASELIRHVRSRWPSVCLVDVEMPEMNGMDVARLIGPHAGMRLIAMTAHEPSVMSQLEDAGFDACLFKPVSLNDLASAVGLPVPKNCSPAETSARACDLSALTAFASGDPEAERDILDSLVHDLTVHVSTLEAAFPTLDRTRIAHVSHKALPVMTMVGAQSVSSLQAMSPEHIGELTDGDLQRRVLSVLQDLRYVLRQAEQRLRR